MNVRVRTPEQITLHDAHKALGLTQDAFAHVTQLLFRYPGFQDGNWFLRAFRGWTGMTLGEFGHANSQSGSKVHCFSTHGVAFKNQV